MTKIMVSQLPSVKNEEQMRHLVRYVNFINSRPERDLIKNGKCFDIHHIVPKSLNGKNSKSNLIKLTHREHYIAHMILWKTYGGKMAQAFWYMSKLCKNSKSFESLRTDVSALYSKLHKGKTISIEHRKKISDFHKNKTLTIETRKKISQSLKGRKHTKEHNEKVSIAKTGNLRSEESKKKQSNSVMGIKNPFYGKHHSEENKLKMGVNKKTIYVNKNNKNKRIKEKDIETYLENGYNIGMYRKNAKGRIWVNNGIESKMIFPNELNLYVENNFIIGRMKN